MGAGKTGQIISYWLTVLFWRERHTSEKQQTEYRGSKLTTGRKSAVSIASREELWLFKFQQQLQLDQESMSIHVDSRGCFPISKENVLNGRTKHIDRKYQMIMDNAKKDKGRSEHVLSDKNISDVMTRALGKRLFTMFRNLMGATGIATCIP